MSSGKTDEQLVQMICEGREQRNAALTSLYHDKRLRSTVRSLAMKQFPTLDYRDVLQETFIIFDRNIREGKFRGESSIASYITGIAKWVMLGRVRQDRKAARKIPDADMVESTWSPLETDDERLPDLLKVISQIGERCKTLIALWAQNIAMKAIALEVNLKDADAAKKEVYRCRERIKKLYQTMVTARSDD